MLAFALALCGWQMFAQTNTGIIEGRILNVATREPVPNVQVTLIAPSANTNLSPDAAGQLAAQTAALIESGIRAGVSQDAIDNAVANLQRNQGGGGRGAQTAIAADNQGRFTIKDLAPGRYSVRIAREGYFGPPQNGNVPAQALKTVNVTAGATALVDFALTQGGVISGRVRDPNGQAVSGIQVAAYRLTYNNGRKVWTQFGTKATDDRGEYRIFWIPPGDYYVGVVPRVPGPVPGPQDSWSRTFFPGVTEPDAAGLVSITNGGESPGTDINIRPATTSLFKITGVARNPYARPNAAGTVDQSVSQFYLVPRELSVLDTGTPPSVQNVLPLNARPNGEFEIRNVRPGSYDLIPYFLEPVPAGTTTPSPPPSRYRFSRNPIEVRNADVTGLSLSLAAGLEMTGEVVVTGASAQPVRKESIRLNLRPFTGIALPMASGSGVPDSAGRFSVTNLPPDRYTLIAAGLPEGVFVSDLRQAAASVFDTGFVVDGNANPVQVILDAGGVQVNGVVLNAERMPVPNATVVLVPPAERRQNAMLYRNAPTDDSGRFTLRSVPPGAYTLYAWESVLPTAWQNAEFLANYEGRGIPLLVAPQSKPDVQVPVIPIDSRQ
jgi:hypothetical protein